MLIHISMSYCLQKYKKVLGKTFYQNNLKTNCLKIQVKHHCILLVSSSGDCHLQSCLVFNLSQIYQ